jgi:hypothetical protein
MTRISSQDCSRFLLGSAIAATVMFVIHGSLVAIGLMPALWLFSLILLTHASLASLFYLMLRETPEEKRLRQLIAWDRERQSRSLSASPKSRPSSVPPAGIASDSATRRSG